MYKYSPNLLTKMVLISVVMLSISTCSTEKSSAPLPLVSGENTAQPTTGISSTEAAQLIPLAISSLIVEAVDKRIELKWTGTGEDDIHYEIYRSFSGSENQKIAIVNIVGDNRGAYTFTDTNVQPSTMYTYGIRTISFYGKESALVQSPNIGLPSS